jgi:Nif-specific regulatory protein
LAKLTEYPWPGNVRELANTIERLIVMAENDVILLEDLSLTVRGRNGRRTPSPSRTAVKPESLSNAIEHIEKREIIHALRSHNYIQQRASQAMGITARQLNYRIKRYGINLRKI